MRIAQKTVKEHSSQPVQQHAQILQNQALIVNG